MSDGSAQDWIDDLTDPSDEEETTSSLFEENFRKMVEDGDLADMAVSTLESQVERIDDPSILAEAMEVDDREDAQEIYQDRVGAINEETDAGKTDGSDEDEESEQEPDSDDSEDSDDDVNDVLDDVVDNEEAEEVEWGGDGDHPGDEDEEKVPVPDDDPEDVLDEAADEDADEEEAEDGPEPPESDEASQSTAEDSGGDVSDGLPDVDVGSLAPDAISREQAAEQDKQRTLLVWGPEGSGKSHIAHSAPEPICYIDTEGKADELAEKFDKRIHYFVADNYKEVKSSLDQALDVLHEYLDAGVRGTLVVDSMTAMWEYAKVDYAKFAYQTENLSEVNFQSELEGSKDWTKIKSRHNAEFREVILESPFHVVFTSGQKEDYDAVFEGGGKAWVPDGEKWNRYAVKDVVRLRRDESGKTVADLQKAAKTRYSFAGLEWPTFDSIYEAIDEIYAAEQADSEIDVTDWPFSVIDGQPVGNSPDGSDDDGSEDDGD